MTDIIPSLSKMFFFFIECLISEVFVLMGKPGCPRTFAKMGFHNQKIGLGSVDASESTVSRQEYLY